MYLLFVDVGRFARVPADLPSCLSDALPTPSRSATRAAWLSPEEPPHEWQRLPQLAPSRYFGRDERFDDSLTVVAG